MVSRIQNHALARAQFQHGLAHIGSGPTDLPGGSLIRIHAQAPRQLAEAQRHAQPVGGQLELHGRHHGPRGELQVRVAIPQIQGGRLHPLERPARAVVQLHAPQHLRNLRAICADVLHRRGTHGAGDPAQALQPAEPSLDSRGHQLIPFNSRKGSHHTSLAVDRHPCLARRVTVSVFAIAYVTVTRAQQHHNQLGYCIPIADHEVRSAADDKQWLRVGVQKRNDLGNSLRRRAFDNPGGCGADAQGGHFGEGTAGHTGAGDGNWVGASAAEALQKVVCAFLGREMCVISRISHITKGSLLA